MVFGLLGLFLLELTLQADLAGEFAKIDLIGVFLFGVRGVFGVFENSRFIIFFPPPAFFFAFSAGFVRVGVRVEGFWALFRGRNSLGFLGIFFLGRSPIGWSSTYDDVTGLLVVDLGLVVRGIGFGFGFETRFGIGFGLVILFGIGGIVFFGVFFLGDTTLVGES